MLEFVDNTQPPASKRVATAGPVDPVDIAAVRRFQGRSYLRNGIVTSLTCEGYVDDPYADRAIYFAATNSYDQILGCSRLIPMTPLGLPTLGAHQIFDEYRSFLGGQPAHQIGEVSALAVAGSVTQRFEVSSWLYREMFHYCVRHDVMMNVVASVGEPLLRILSRLLGLPTQIVGEVREQYLGCDRTPISFDVANFLNGMTNPRSREFFADGLIIDLTDRSARRVAELP